MDSNLSDEELLGIVMYYVKVRKNMRLTLKWVLTTYHLKIKPAEVVHMYNELSLGCREPNHWKIIYHGGHPADPSTWVKKEESSTPTTSPTQL